MNPFETLQRPVLSERSNNLREAEGKYTFVVRLDASKADIKNALEKVYNVKVESVRTAIRRGKQKRRGMAVVQGSKTKRAIVQLAKGAKLPIFEEQ